MKSIFTISAISFFLFLSFISYSWAECDPFYNYSIDYSKKKAWHIIDNRTNKIIDSGYTKMEFNSEYSNRLDVEYHYIENDKIIGRANVEVTFETWDEVTVTETIELCLERNGTVGIYWVTKSEKTEHHR